jgi:D-tagatose-1,6-bisphosphate aldolase subunit GatZ/KbaZ
VPDSLQELVVARKVKNPLGIYSVCSAHPWVLEAAIEQAIDDDSHVLIEATSNQVNHHGGYTGLQPEDFRRIVLEIAKRKGLDTARVILGGDHLGPNPWQRLPAADAMAEAALLVQAYVRAGFEKIHLDASMPCAGDPHPLPTAIIAQRTVALCAVAEEASSINKPRYVIGTEVPVPGGTTESLCDLVPTRGEDAAETLNVHKKLFEKAGLGEAWARVIALVVQPGVEFNHDSVIDYDAGRASHLTALLDSTGGIVFEAHSTDYQKPEAYRALVRDGFAILKVGPALTFAMREALESLSLIEMELVPPEQQSALMDVLERVMLNDRRYWKDHYFGDERAQRILRRYSYSDRVRYYWNHPEAKRAVNTLVSNLRSTGIPETVLATFMPDQYSAVRAGRLKPDPEALVQHRIKHVLRVYADACGTQTS